MATPTITLHLDRACAEWCRRRWAARGAPNRFERRRQCFPPPSCVKTVTGSPGDVRPPEIYVKTVRTAIERTRSLGELVDGALEDISALERKIRP
jgi:hypothetical protein